MYLFFDTETTGLPKNWKAPITDFANWPRLVQLAYIFYDEQGNKILSGDHIIKPDGYFIPLDSTKVHGITNQRALAEGMSISSVLENFDQHISKATHLVAHNALFDQNILGSEFLRNGMSNTISNKVTICTMLKSTNYCAIPGQYGFKWPKLTELHFKLFNVGFEEAHNASVDIGATAKCFWELRRLGRI